MIETIEKEKFYSPEDLAKYFGVSISTVYKLIRRKELPHIRLGKVYRVPASDLQRFIAKHGVSLTFHASPKIPATVTKFLDLLRSAKIKKNIYQVWLYGSYARGDYTSDSDVDLLIVTQEKSITISNMLEELGEKAMAASDYKELLSIHEIDQDEWGKMEKERYPLVQSIEQEGIPLWTNH